jgi:hypothetical protein
VDYCGLGASGGKSPDSEESPGAWHDGLREGFS